jgi:hypothetical protein
MTSEKPSWPVAFEHQGQDPHREFLPARGEAAVLYKYWHKAAISKVLRRYLYGQADDDLSAARAAEAVRPELPEEIALAEAAEAVAELWWEWVKRPFSVAALEVLADPVDPPPGGTDAADRDPRPFFKRFEPAVLAAAERASESIGRKYAPWNAAGRA